MPNYTVKLNQKTWEAFDGDTDIARAVVFSDKAEPTAMIKVPHCPLLSRCPAAPAAEPVALASPLDVCSASAHTVTPGTLRQVPQPAQNCSRFQIGEGHREGAQRDVLPRAARARSGQQLEQRRGRSLQGQGLFFCD
jgi:hypothetical protein